GQDFDDRLASHHYNPAIPDPEYARHVQTAAEKAKCALSSTDEAWIDSKELEAGELVTLEEFEDLCGDLFLKIRELVSEVLADAEIPNSDVDTILLVGGSSRIPKVQRIVSDFFHGKQFQKINNPDVAVVVGAAVHAAVLTGVNSEIIKNLRLRDALPVSLGFVGGGGLMNPRLKRNQPLPAKKTGTFTITNPSLRLVTLFEGNRKMALQNNKHIEFTLSDMPSVPGDRRQVDITLDVDANGMLSAYATD
ncbi:heat shock protein 70 family, partial [Blyttiomyces helicus]